MSIASIGKFLFQHPKSMFAAGTVAAGLSSHAMNNATRRDDTAATLGMMASIGLMGAIIMGATPGKVAFGGAAATIAAAAGGQMLVGNGEARPTVTVVQQVEVATNSDKPMFDKIKSDPRSFI